MLCRQQVLLDTCPAVVFDCSWLPVKLQQQCKRWLPTSASLGCSALRQTPAAPACRLQRFGVGNWQKIVNDYPVLRQRTGVQLKDKVC